MVWAVRKRTEKADYRVTVTLCVCWRTRVGKMTSKKTPEWKDGESPEAIWREIARKRRSHTKSFKKEMSLAECQNGWCEVKTETVVGKKSEGRSQTVTGSKDHCQPKCPLWASSSGIIWKCNAKSQVPPQTEGIRSVIHKSLVIRIHSRPQENFGFYSPCQENLLGRSEQRI
jgi:hypothetical protein